MYAFIVGFNEWVLKGWVAGQGWKRSKSKDATVGNMTVRSSGS